MKITKFVNSCLLVEMPGPVNRTILFDPGKLSESILSVENLEYLDDIIITHEHGDHYSPELIKEIQAKFPDAKVKSPVSMVSKLEAEGIKTTTDAVDGIEIIDAPHAEVKPLFDYVDNIGIHYIKMLTHPGDSYHITESMPILALPIAPPWGDSVTALNLALQLKPKHVLPIHDFHWNDLSKSQMYELFERELDKVNITFHKLIDKEPVVIDI